MHNDSITITNLSIASIIESLKSFCSYRERCIKEIRIKLFGYKLQKQDVDKIISCLIKENIVNEERFAFAFASGKFKINEWGKIKIRAGLKQFEIKEELIKKVLSSIPNDDYKRILEKLAKKKFQQLHLEKNLFIKRKKTQDFLLSKGYEKAAVIDVLNKI